VKAVEAATAAELEQLGITEASPGLAAVALRLAKTLDNVTLKAPTSAAIVARELRATMVELRKTAPVRQEGDGLDDLARKRAERLADSPGESSATGL
jgi:hypothetical protein